MVSRKTSGRKPLTRSLTKTAIDKLSYDEDGPKQQILWDPVKTGFGVRVYSTGRKSFVVGYRVKGRWRLMVLAQYGVITLDEAWKRAKKVLGRAADDDDVLEERQQARRAETVAQLKERHIEYAKTRNKTWAKDDSRLDRWVVSAIGSRKIESIELRDIQAIHDRISKHAPYEANRTVEVLSKMFNLARQWKLYPPELPNPCQGVEKNKEVSRAEYVPPEKMPDLLAAIDTEKDVYVRNFFWLALLTGMRRGELLNIKWENIDLKDKRVYLPVTKSGQPRYVPLNDAAVEIIKNTPKMLQNAYLLPGRVQGKPLYNVDKPWTRIRKAADLPRLRVHDLRRTAGSYMVQAGSSIYAVKEVLGHQSTKTTEIYARLAEQQSRDAVEAHGKALLVAANSRKNGEQTGG